MATVKGMSLGFLISAVSALAVTGQEPRPSSSPWRIADQPTLRIGVSSEADQVLWHIRDIVANSRAELVVANDGESQVLIYSQDGRLAHAFGRSGEGPGEFRQITSVGVGANDSIFIFDRALQRISVFGSEGTYARSVRVDAPPPAAFVGMMRRLGNGTWLAREAMPATLGANGQILRDTVHYSLRNPDGSVIADLGTAQAAMNAAFDTPGGVAQRTVPFTPILTESVVGRCAVIVEGDSEAILTVDLEQRTLNAVHTNAESLEPRDSDVEKWLVASTRSVPAQAKAQVTQVLASLPIPAAIPLYRDVLLDDLGYIWLQHYEPPLGGSSEWSVYDWSGAKRGVYRFPSDSQPRWIGASRIAAVLTDALDVESIAVYGLDRGDGAMEPAVGRTCR